MESPIEINTKIQKEDTQKKIEYEKDEILRNQEYIKETNRKRRYTFESNDIQDEKQQKELSKQDKVSKSKIEINTSINKLTNNEEKRIKKVKNKKIKLGNGISILVQKRPSSGKTLPQMRTEQIVDKEKQDPIKLCRNSMILQSNVKREPATKRITMFGKRVGQPQLHFRRS